MPELVIPAVRSRVPTTAGAVTRFTHTGAIAPRFPADRVTQTQHVEQTADWLRQLDASLGDALQAFGERLPEQVRPLSLIGRPVAPAASSAATIRSAVALPAGGLHTRIGDLDPLRPVTDGSFEVNGVPIAVSADDQLAQVLDRINSARHGVFADYNAITDRVSLVANVKGSRGAVELSGDTSGLLHALRLDEAAPTPGFDGGYDRPIGTINGLASVASGNIRINDVEVPVDVNTDSIDTIAARITDLTDGTATFDRTTGRLMLSADLPPGFLRIVDETGFLNASGIRPGVYVPAASDPGLTEHAVMVISSVLEQMDQRFTEVFGDTSSYQPAAITQLKVGYRDLTKQAAANGWSSVLDRAAIAPSADATASPTSPSDAAIVRLQLLREDQAEAATRFFRGSPTSSIDGFFDQLRQLIRTAGSGLEAEASSLRQWVA